MYVTGTQSDWAASVPTPFHDKARRRATRRRAADSRFIWNGLYKQENAHGRITEEDKLFCSARDSLLGD